MVVYKAALDGRGGLLAAKRTTDGGGATGLLAVRGVGGCWPWEQWVSVPPALPPCLLTAALTDNDGSSCDIIM